MSKVLITGVAGFIGYNLAKLMMARGYEVVGIDNFDPYYDPTIKHRRIKNLTNKKYYFTDGCYFHFYRIDIRNQESISWLMNEYKFDGVIHLAALAGVRPSLQRPADYMDVNVRGSTILLEQCRLHGIKNVVVASSSSVYGDRVTGACLESLICTHPESPYAASKRAMELICDNFSRLYDMDIKALRYFTVYGPGQRPEMAIHQFIRKAMLGEEITLFGSMESKRDYTYIDDICEGTLAAYRHTPGGFSIFNLGNNRPIELIDLVFAVHHHTGKELNLKCLPKQPGDVHATWAHPGLALKELNWEATTPFEEGMRLTSEWAKEKYQ